MFKINFLASVCANGSRRVPKLFRSCSGFSAGEQIQKDVYVSDKLLRLGEILGSIF